jgi:hypothetical protein
MAAPVENDASRQTESSAFRVGDMSPLIGRVREFLVHHGEGIRTYDASSDLLHLEDEERSGQAQEARADVVLAEDTAVELGHPLTPSLAMVLTCYQPQLVRHGEISILGPDVDEIESGDRRPFAQIIMLSFRNGDSPDPFQIDRTQYLTRRLPGYMVRSVPGKAWVRISRAAMAAGLTIKTVGSALIDAYMHDFETLEKAEVAFVTSCEKDVEALTQIAYEASILAGKHKKLVLGVDGEVECQELNCETCDDKPVCDNLRDIVIKRRSRRQ